jgi:hypothetical protein
MTTHVGLLALFSLFVALIFAVLMRETPPEQGLLGARLFAALVGGALVLAWLMYPLPL